MLDKLRNEFDAANEVRLKECSMKEIRIESVEDAVSAIKVLDEMLVECLLAIKTVLSVDIIEDVLIKRDAASISSRAVLFKL